MNSTVSPAQSVSAKELEEQVEPASELESPSPLTTRKQLRKILREDSNWSIRSITITALTGVSAALIATQLTGLVSSLVLIALMSFVTASMSEIYRVFLALTGFGAKRAAAITSKKIPLLGTNAAVEEPESKQLMSGAIHVVSDAYKLNDEQKSHRAGPLKRALYHVKNYGKANPFLWLVGVFLLTALTSISVTYLVTGGEPPQIIQRTVIHTEELSNDDKSAIVTEAKDQALNQLESTSSTTVTPVVTKDQATTDQLADISSRLAALEAEIAASKTQVPSTEQPTNPNAANDQSTINTLLAKLAALQAETDALNKRIADLEAAKNNTGTPAPTSGGTGATAPANSQTPSKVDSK